MIDKRLWVLTLAAVALSLPIPAQALETLSGRVTNAQGGLGLAGIDLDVFYADGGVVAATGDTSGANGNFTITLPGPGNYTLRADASESEGFVDQYYNGAFLPSAAQSIPVAAGQAVSGINFALNIGFDISGTIRSASNSAALAGIDIDVFASNGEFLSGYPATSLANGTFLVGALPPGTYFLRADPDPLQGQYFVRTYFGGTQTLSSATPVVMASRLVSNINITLPRGGTIAGRVTDTLSSAGLAGLDLDVFDAAGALQTTTARTDANGGYVMGPLLPGQYTLRVDPDVTQGHPRVYFNNVTDSGLSTLINVTEGSETGGIDFSLPRAGTISGTIRDGDTGGPLAGIDLDCYDASGKRADTTAITGSGGEYTIGPVLPGLYTLRADPSAEQAYARQYFEQQISIVTADAIEVAASSDTAGVDFLLDRAGDISGVITDASTGDPLSGIDIDVFEAGSLVRLEQTTKTDANGAYQVTNLPPGSYLLRGDPVATPGFARTYYGNVTNPGDADAIALLPGESRGGIDIALAAGIVGEGADEGEVDGEPVTEGEGQSGTEAENVTEGEGTPTEGEGEGTPDNGGCNSGTLSAMGGQGPGPKGGDIVLFGFLSCTLAACAALGRPNANVGRS